MNDVIQRARELAAQPLTSRAIVGDLYTPEDMDKAHFAMDVLPALLDVLAAVIVPARDPAGEYTYEFCAACGRIKNPAGRQLHEDDCTVPAALATLERELPK